MEAAKMSKVEVERRVNAGEGTLVDLKPEDFIVEQIKARGCDGGAWTVLFGDGHGGVVNKRNAGGYSCHVAW